MRARLFLILLLIAPQGFAGQMPGVTAATADGIRMDGRLDEPFWSAAVAAPFVQQSPRAGAPSPYVTTVRVAADASHLYFGFTCTDPSPDRIAIHTMQRDGDMSGDDSVAIVLGTFGDQRTGYYFRVNASGARADGLVNTPEDVPLDWDGVWDARVARSASAWTAEIAIPVSSLRFDPARERWGFNAERYVPRETQTLRWTSATLDARLADFRRSGELELPPLRQGHGVTVNLNTLSRRTSDFTTDHRTLTGRSGVDVGYNPSPQFGGLITVKTDFAETEVDTRQINLTQFPLFFPEKRSFFLEGSDQFKFALNLGTDFVPFYSRRIGLVEGSSVPIEAGAKVLGRAGRWGITALDTRTGDAHEIRGRNLFAGRVTYDASKHLRIGTLVTSGDPAAQTENRLGAVDATWATSTLFGDKNFAASVWGAASHTEGLHGRDNGWGFIVDYPNDLWDIVGSVKTFGDALNPALGFLPRPGTRKYSFGASYQPRVEKSWIQQHFFEFEPNMVTDLDGRTLSWRIFTAPFNAESTSGVHLEANYAPEYQRLTEPFAITDRVTIPTGEYRFDRFRVEGQSSPARPLRAGATVWFGTFYDGRLTQTSGFVTWSGAQGRLQLELDAENDFGRLPFGNFVQRLLRTKAVYAFSPNLILSSYAQYDTDSRHVGMNNRLRWTIRPEADLFVVWNRGWKHPLGEEEGTFALRPVDDQLVVKLRWILRQ